MDTLQTTLKELADLPNLTPKKTLLPHLPLSEGTRQSLLFDADGRARLVRNERDPDSHNITVQVTRGGSGLRFEAATDDTGINSWRREVLELEDGAVQITDSIEPHYASRGDGVDNHIKEVQRDCERLMSMAFGDKFRGLDQHPDIFYGEQVEDVRKGATGKELKRHGYNTERIEMETIIRPDNRPTRTVTASLDIATAKDKNMITYERQRYSAKFEGDQAIPDSRQSATQTLKIRR